jgi:hypothetical protein
MGRKIGSQVDKWLVLGVVQDGNWGSSRGQQSSYQQRSPAICQPKVYASWLSLTQVMLTCNVNFKIYNTWSLKVISIQLVRTLPCLRQLTLCCQIAQEQGEYSISRSAAHRPPTTPIIRGMYVVPCGLNLIRRSKDLTMRWACSTFVRRRPSQWASESVGNFTHTGSISSSFLKPLMNSWWCT